MRSFFRIAVLAVLVAGTACGAGDEAQDKPVQGGMPPASATLTDDEIAQVALYERVALGNQDEAVGEEDCGFLDEEASAAG